MYIYHHHHHHVVLLAQISLTLSRHFSLSFIASGRSSRLNPVSSHSRCMYVRADRPAFAQPYVGVHRSTSLMSSSLLNFFANLTYMTLVILHTHTHARTHAHAHAHRYIYIYMYICKHVFLHGSYQRLKKCYSMVPCLTLGIIRYGSRVK